MKNPLKKTNVFLNKYRVGSPKGFRLADFPPDDSLKFIQKKDEDQLIQSLQEKLAVLQALLYAEHKHKVLIVLQGMDTAGKDGVIKHVFQGINPQGVRVAAFKVPTPEEADHDYLWRVHQKTPAKGEIVIFNRSHYEDVLVTRVHHLAPDKLIEKRYGQIHHFEKMLTEEGAIILKFFLHISFEEQARRLRARLDNPEKNWKFNSADLQERKFWPAYVQAYEKAISATATAWAPWYIVPSDQPKQRNFFVSLAVTAALDQLNMRYPAPEQNLKNIKIV
ncbi:MAG: polyphosphate kinase 2 family protein [Candidatus Omnitrophica bacterium]|nr:polyphosphate kinase 2 family protein [Candidatus Omnitrophota bacterium]